MDPITTKSHIVFYALGREHFFFCIWETNFKATLNMNKTKILKKPHHANPEHWLAVNCCGALTSSKERLRIMPNENIIVTTRQQLHRKRSFIDYRLSWEAPKLFPD